MNARDVIVLKFGSSVLRSAIDLPDTIDEVYRYLREGKHVLAVVSAFDGRTDQLLAEAHAVFGQDAPEATASYVATGESQSAAMLTGVLLRAGVAARTIDPREVQLKVHGDLLNAELDSVDCTSLCAWFECVSVLVLPGFFGIDGAGRIGLLDRGGSDYTALFLAQRLHVQCRLVKNVPGVYDLDPATAGGDAHLLSRIGWEAAIPIAGRLVQAKALRYGCVERLPFTVGALSAAEETKVGNYSATLATPHCAAPPLKIALLGLGPVGGGVYARLAAQPDRFQIVCIVVKHREKHLSTVPHTLLSTNPWDGLTSSADLVIECMGGVSPAAEVVMAALEGGQTVISANKTLLARYWKELEPYIVTKTPRLHFGAAVGGALPVLELLRGHAPRVRRVRGIVNGTCNYILDALRQGADFDSAVGAAQAAGLAEADPSRDLSGADAADKLALIARVGFNAELPEDSMSVRGIDARTESSGVYLVATVARNGDALSAHVAPQVLDGEDFLAGARRRESNRDRARARRWTGSPTGWARRGSMADHHRRVRGRA